MEKTIQELIQDLNDDDEFVQEEAFVLLEIRAEVSFEPLLDLLTARGVSKDLKKTSIKILGFIGNDKAIESLIASLRDNNKLVRREASTALSRMGEKAVDPLIDILKDDDWRVRGAAAWALGKIGDKCAIEPLNALLDDESGFVSSGAKFAIEGLNKS